MFMTLDDEVLCRSIWNVSSVTGIDLNLYGDTERHILLLKRLPHPSILLDFMP